MLEDFALDGVEAFDAGEDGLHPGGQFGYLDELAVDLVLFCGDVDLFVTGFL
jgi:hypothetical protein